MAGGFRTKFGEQREVPSAQSPKSFEAKVQREQRPLLSGGHDLIERCRAWRLETPQAKTDRLLGCAHAPKLIPRIWQAGSEHRFEEVFDQVRRITQ